MNIAATSLAILVAFRAATVISHAQVTYDAQADFSTTHNPAGVWTYGYSGSLGAFTKFPTNNGDFSGEFIWSRNDIDPTLFPLVAKNLSGQIIQESYNILQIDEFALHPGNSANDQYAIVRFTAPTNGIYTFNASFWGLHTQGAGTTSHAHVLVNRSPFFAAAVIGYSNQVSVASPFVITLRVGETIDFAVGNGGNNFVGDYTALAAKVTLVRETVPTDIYTAVEVVWRAEAGKTYQVQSSTTVLTNEWVNIGSPVPGDDSLKSLFDSTRGQPKKFYRVVLVP
jgi:hypothetical protein